jgi:hypothetical protein
MFSSFHAKKNLAKDSDFSVFPRKICDRNVLVCLLFHVLSIETSPERKRKMNRLFFKIKLKLQKNEDSKQFMLKRHNNT